MAVAVKNATDAQMRTGKNTLIVSSVLGAVYILGAIAVVAWGVPYLWHTGVAQYLPAGLAFVSAAGLIVVLLVSIGLLGLLGSALVGPSPPQGLRAGIFSVLAWTFATVLVTTTVGRLFELWLANMPAVGLALMTLVGLGLLVWGWLLLNRPKTVVKLQAFEEQGWFSTERYKASQGLRVRRSTMLGIMLLGGAGIYALYNYGTLVTGPPHWLLRVPFTRQIVPHPDVPGVVITEWMIPLLPDVQFTVPLLLAAATFWLAFRVVNLPVFADFLIATEAELNKVSWPTRKSVFQDTIVVLVTVLLMTIFLFIVDLAWGYLLSWEVVGVIKKPPERPAEQRQVEQLREGQIPW